MLGSIRVVRVIDAQLGLGYRLHSLCFLPSYDFFLLVLPSYLLGPCTRSSPFLSFLLFPISKDIVRSSSDPSVNLPHASCDVARLVTQQESNHLGHFFRLRSTAANRVVARDREAELGIGVFHEGSLDEATIAA